MSAPRNAEEARLRAAYDRLGLDRSRVPARFASPGDAFILAERERVTLAALRRWFPAGLGGRRVLDLGAGNGLDVVELLGYGVEPWDVLAVDLLGDRLRGARRRLPTVGFVQANGAALPCPDGSIDLALQFTMMSSVLDPALRSTIAAELTRVLRPGGVLLWYDLRVDNPRNPSVRGVPAAEIRALFPQCEVALQRVSLAPPLARRVVPWSPFLAAVLGTLPVLRSHLFGVVRR